MHSQQRIISRSPVLSMHPSRVEMPRGGAGSALQPFAQYSHSSQQLRGSPVPRVKLQAHISGKLLAPSPLLKQPLPQIEKQRRKQAAKVNEYLKPYYNSARNSKSHQ